MSDNLSINFLVPELSKIESFNGSHFKRWEERVLLLLEMIGVSCALIEAKPPENNQEQYEPTRSHSDQVWEKANQICRCAILSAMTNNLYNVYYKFGTTTKIGTI